MGILGLGVAMPCLLSRTLLVFAITAAIFPVFPLIAYAQMCQGVPANGGGLNVKQNMPSAVRPIQTVIRAIARPRVVMVNMNATV